MGEPPARFPTAGAGGPVRRDEGRRHLLLATAGLQPPAVRGHCGDAVPNRLDRSAVEGGGGLVPGDEALHPFLAGITVPALVASIVLTVSC